MKRYISTSLFLLLAWSMGTGRGLAQSGNPYPPPPPDIPHLGGQIENDNPAAPILDGVLTINHLDRSKEDRVGYVRNVARSLLAADRMSVVYAAEDGAVPIDNLSDGETVVRQVRYHKLTLDALTDRFFDGVKNFLITDGQKYFQIRLDSPRPPAPSDGTLQEKRSGPER